MSELEKCRADVTYDALKRKVRKAIISLDEQEFENVKKYILAYAYETYYDGLTEAGIMKTNKDRLRITQVMSMLMKFRGKEPYIPYQTPSREDFIELSDLWGLLVG